MIKFGIAAIIVGAVMFLGAGLASKPWREDALQQVIAILGILVAVAGAISAAIGLVMRLL